MSQQPPPDQGRLSRVRAVTLLVLALLGGVVAAVAAGDGGPHTGVAAGCAGLLALLALALGVLDLRRLPPRGRAGGVAGACAVAALVVTLGGFVLLLRPLDADSPAAAPSMLVFLVLLGTVVTVLGCSSWYSARTVRSAAA
ncbi:hypothetical protein KIN34_03000 [Cellulomonas sp. DKR-3]|uniref:Uncharacterized protein n=1 Tax=Cellulomonas fulva TaxID=2835530 RepID=A0ABS5TVU5_9CELL|nr:hypothetical protein [Cellulomonas fulva]MBT0993256.1 hypothetical protein [Cellulomonas fulva]